MPSYSRSRSSMCLRNTGTGPHTPKLEDNFMSSSGVHGTKRVQLREGPVAKVRGGLLHVGRALSEEDKAVLAARLKGHEGSGRRRSWNAGTRKRCILTQYPIMVGAEREGLPCLAGLCSYGDEEDLGAVGMSVDGIVADRNKWFRRVKERWPEALILWVTEIKARGVPYHHLVVIGVPVSEAEELSRQWVAVTKKSRTGHMPAVYLPPGSRGAPNGLNVFQELRAKEQMVGYMFLELASASKAAQKWDYFGRFYTGRCWGVWGNERLAKQLDLTCGSEWLTGAARDIAIDEVRCFWMGLAAQASSSPAGLVRLLLGWSTCQYAVKTSTWAADVAQGQRVAERLEAVRARGSKEGWEAWLGEQWSPEVVMRQGREWQGEPESVRLEVVEGVPRWKEGGPDVDYYLDVVWNEWALDASHVRVRQQSHLLDEVHHDLLLLGL